MKSRIATTLLLFAGLGALAYQVRTTQRVKAVVLLTAYVPQDALLTIESPDFASLLQRWTNSPESKSWLASGDYSVFQNSRLFSRLGDAQTSFETASGIPAGVDFLHEVAGKESIFAWYDIGKLEFLYITRMPSQQAEKSQLLQARGSFQRRHAGNADFYVRTSSADYSTVAFALVPSPSGDLLLLATREDLIANALTLLAAATPTNSIQQEPWFHDASTALPPEKVAPALHMVLNLDRIVPDPHFRSYWVQRNITWTKQFRAAASDLYLESGRFREERTLLPKSPDTTEPPSFDITLLADLAPPDTGILRVTATQDASAAVTAIQQKLLGADTTQSGDSKSAPEPDLAAPQSGSVSDLETRIDALPPASTDASTAELTQVLRSSGIDTVLTLSSAQPVTAKEALWIPIHSAVVLHTIATADVKLLTVALQQALRGSITASNIGLSFQLTQDQGATMYALSGPRSLFFAIAPLPAQGSLILIADDRTLLAELLHRVGTLPSKPSTDITSIGVFNHSTQRAPYLRLTALIDGTNNQPAATLSAPGRDDTAPAFFSRNIGSLSDTFSALQTERVVERIVDQNLHQTVTYTWKTQP
jgi:hypothetical protein